MSNTTGVRWIVLFIIGILYYHLTFFQIFTVVYCQITGRRNLISHNCSTLHHLSQFDRLNRPGQALITASSYKLQVRRRLFTLGSNSLSLMSSVIVSFSLNPASHHLHSRHKYRNAFPQLQTPPFSSKDRVDDSSRPDLTYLYTAQPSRRSGLTLARSTITNPKVFYKKLKTML